MIDVTMTERKTPIRFWYRNHRGELAMRRVLPLAVEWGVDYSTELRQECWLLRAFCLDRCAERSFVLEKMNIMGAVVIKECGDEQTK